MPPEKRAIKREITMAVVAVGLIAYVLWQHVRYLQVHMPVPTPGTWGHLLGC